MVQTRHLKRVVKPKSAAAQPTPPVPEVVEKPTKEPIEDEGLVGLLMGMKFDRDNDSSLNCPSCGEDISIEKGLCQKCHELIRAKDPHSFEARVLPVIEDKNVVYVHLDVTTGAFTFVRKTARQKVELREINLEPPLLETPSPLCNP